MAEQGKSRERLLALVSATSTARPGPEDVLSRIDLYLARWVEALRWALLADAASSSGAGCAASPRCASCCTRSRRSPRLLCRVYAAGHTAGRGASSGGGTVRRTCFFLVQP